MKTKDNTKKKAYKKGYKHCIKMLHVCSPIEQKSYKQLLNYYYNKLN